MVNGPFQGLFLAVFRGEVEIVPGLFRCKGIIGTCIDDSEPAHFRGILPDRPQEESNQFGDTPQPIGEPSWEPEILGPDSVSSPFNDAVEK